MINETELAFQREVSNDVSVRECNSCEFFALDEGLPVCLFDSPDFLDCRLVRIELSNPV